MIGGQPKNIDREGIRGQLMSYEGLLGELESALTGFPTPADGGAAVDEITAIVGALKARAESLVALEKVLKTVTLQVVDSLLAGDKDAASVFGKMSLENFDD